MFDCFHMKADQSVYRNILSQFCLLKLCVRMRIRWIASCTNFQVNAIRLSIFTTKRTVFITFVAKLIHKIWLMFALLASCLNQTIFFLFLFFSGSWFGPISLSFDMYAKSQPSVASFQRCAKWIKSHLWTTIDVFRVSSRQRRYLFCVYSRIKLRSPLLMLQIVCPQSIKCEKRIKFERKKNYCSIGSSSFHEKPKKKNVNEKSLK